MGTCFINFANDHTLYSGRSNCGELKGPRRPVNTQRVFSMKRLNRILGCLFLLLTGLPIAGPAAASPAIISTHASERAGIVVATLQASRIAPSIPALGVVLDAAPLVRLSGSVATLNAQVAAAEAKVALERQQMAQASDLYKRQTTSLADYQKAEEDLAANEAILAQARAKRASQLAEMEATWGSAMAHILHEGSDPLPQLVAGKTMLVGLSLQPGTKLTTPPQDVEGEAAGSRFSLRLIGSVPGMLGGYPGQSFLYQGAAQHAVPVGAVVTASMAAGPERPGVLVPGSAVVWQNGHAFVFQTRDGTHFEPVRISTAAPSGDGYFVSAELTAGSRIAVRGGGVLLGLLAHAPTGRHD